MMERRCSVCDEWYDPNGARAHMHQHLEPQSGPYRDSWIKSGLPYGDWLETAEGKCWAINSQVWLRWTGFASSN